MYTFTHSMAAILFTKKRSQAEALSSDFFVLIASETTAPAAESYYRIVTVKK